MKATKSFQHIHMSMLKFGQLTTFPHTHSHAKMKAAQSFQQIHTLAKLKEGKVFPTHTHTSRHKQKCRQGRTFPDPCTGEHKGIRELYHTHTHAKRNADKIFSRYACICKNEDSSRRSRILIDTLRWRQQRGSYSSIRKLQGHYELSTHTYTHRTDRLKAPPRTRKNDASKKLSPNMHKSQTQGLKQLSKTHRQTRRYIRSGTRIVCDHNENCSLVQNSRSLITKNR